MLLSIGGGLFGAYRWYLSAVTGKAATSGEVMLAAFPLLVGLQLLLSTLQFDVQNVPREPLSRRMPGPLARSARPPLNSA
jgi:hypothetical protein